MWIEEVPPERLAEFVRHFHRTLEVFAKGNESAFWKEIAEPDKNRLVAGARLTIFGLHSTNESAKPRQYFAKPGEAEWGC